MTLAPDQDEDARLAALDEFDVLDTAPERPFERIVELIQKLIGVPMATITFVDRDRQWFKARRGLAFAETARSVSVCDHTIRNVEPMVVPDLTADERFASLPCVTDPSPIQAYLGIPLVTEDNYALGALCAMDHVPREFTPDQIAILKEFALLVVDWLEMRRMAQTDFLTGTMARRAFVSAVATEMARHGRSGRPATLAIFDIDHFKTVNDRHGHAAGDQVLRIVAAITQDNLRDGDLFGRIGGEEFALLMPETPLQDAEQVLERLRTAIEQAAIGDPGLSVTASFGLCALSPGHGFPDVWMDAADKALYRAKEAGRNRIEIAPA